MRKGGFSGPVGYRMYYGNGPVFRDGEYDFRNELDNDQFNATELGYDLAVTAYHAAAGCVLGQALSRLPPRSPSLYLATTNPVPIHARNGRPPHPLPVLDCGLPVHAAGAA
ncbi:MAG TPA: hypothetical protein HA272_02355, partial [Methanoregula sp.]|nr:hypothetical protein [Methanoregula sp.]